MDPSIPELLYYKHQVLYFKLVLIINIKSIKVKLVYIDGL